MKWNWTVLWKKFAAEKIQAKAEILKDIYGEQKGTNDQDFLGKLNSLDRRWESLCPGFFQWFCNNRVDKFLESLICLAPEGTEVVSLYYQNDSKSMDFVERRNSNLEKRTWLMSLRMLAKWYNNHKIEEIRALYEAGHYELAMTHKRFAIDSARWHSWPEKHCASNANANF